MKGIAADIRHAVRLYQGTPSSSMIANLVLGAAMACVVSFLSLYSAIALKPHPGFEQSHALATIGQSDGNRFVGLPHRLIERIDEEVTSVKAIAGASGWWVSLEPGETETRIELVTRGFFTDLRPRLALGRGFDEREHEEGGEPVAVISHEYWQVELGGRSDVIGQRVRISGTPHSSRPLRERSIEYRIIGVMAPSNSLLGAAALWLPYEQAVPRHVGSQMSTYGIARLEPGVSTESLASELNGRYADLGGEIALRRGYRLDALRGVYRNINTQRDAQRQVRLFLAGSLLLALVAACNASLFLLSRAPGRQRELAIRLAVGAALKRLARQLVIEAALLVVGAVVLGVLLASWLAVLIQELAFLEQAQWHDVTLLDWRVAGSLQRPRWCSLGLSPSRLCSD